jgi:hypothetical protein
MVYYSAAVVLQRLREAALFTARLPDISIDTAAKAVTSYLKFITETVRIVAKQTAFLRGAPIPQSRINYIIDTPPTASARCSACEVPGFTPLQFYLL